MNKEGTLYKLYTNKTLREIFRFLLVGGLATIIDYLVMGLATYFISNNSFDSFLNVFVDEGIETWVVQLSTTLGFISGLIVNYILSIIFVYDNKGNSKSATGFIIFTVLSVIGLLINNGGVYLGYNLIGWPLLIVRMIMTIIVMCYNYVSKRVIIFKKDNKECDLNEEN